ncbi:acyl-coenzyme A thioesterase THEM4-like isoform X1 [Arapaima gigas]
MLRRAVSAFCYAAARAIPALRQRNIALPQLPFLRASLIPGLNSDYQSVTLSWPFSSFRPRDYSLPNPSWSPQMLRLYNYYNNLCEQDGEGGKKEIGPWIRLPSYNRTVKYATGGQCLSKVLQAKARLFTRNIEEEGAAFEYAMFLNTEEKAAVCVFQAGPLLEGPVGNLHGGAIATIIDTVTGALSIYLGGLVVTANLNVNYRSPIPLGSVVLVHAALEKMEDRKIYISCQVTSSDGSKLHTEATALFVKVNVGHLFER